jgi:hypothetical protein
VSRPRPKTTSPLPVIPQSPTRVWFSIFRSHALHPPIDDCALSESRRFQKHTALPSPVLFGQTSIRCEYLDHFAARLHDQIRSPQNCSQPRPKLILLSGSWLPTDNNRSRGRYLPPLRPKSVRPRRMLFAGCECRLPLRPPAGGDGSKSRG